MEVIARSDKAMLEGAHHSYAQMSHFAFGKGNQMNHFVPKNQSCIRHKKINGGDSEGGSVNTHVDREFEMTAPRTLGTILMFWSLSRFESDSLSALSCRRPEYRLRILLMFTKLSIPSRFNLWQMLVWAKLGTNAPICFTMC